VATGTNNQTSVLIADEQTRHLYAGAYLSLSVTLINAIILAYFQWPVIEHIVIESWLVAISAVSIVRLYLTWRFHRLQLDSNGLKRWNNYFLAGVLVAGIVWGSASYFLFPADDVTHQALLAVIIAGMSAGAVSVLSANWNAVILFLVPSLIPLAIRFFSIGDLRFTVLGMAVIMFLLVMLSTAKRNHENVIAAIVARVEKQAKRALQAVLEQMPDVFYRTDPAGKLLMVSPSAQELIGYRTDELLGESLASFYVEKHGREKFLEALTQNNGVVTGYESALRHKDGHVVWVSTNARFYHEANGELAGVEGITRDITAKREMVTELENYKQHLEVLVDERARELKESQARLEYLIKSSPVMIYACKLQDSRLLPVYCSENIRELFGIEPDVFLQNEDFILDNIPADDINSVMQGIQRLPQTNRCTIEYRFNTGSGSYRWIHDELRLIRDEHGTPVEVIGCWLDITDRKNIQRELQSSEQRFRTLVENITDGIFVHSLDGNFIDVNQQACLNLGYTREELLEMSVPDVETGADPDKMKQLWPELKKGRVVSIDGTHKRKDGSTFPVEVNISLIEMGEQPCVIALARDVTRRKQAENRLRQINSELESFAYSVSHDLRAPLRSVNGFCNILLDEYAEQMDETAISYLDRIVAASKKMSNLIDDLLLLSRVSRKDLEPEEIDLSKMFQESLDQIAATDPGREINTNIQAGLLLHADKGLMGVVVNNMVSNAWKYTGLTENAKIEFFSQVQDGQTVYCLRDNGAGFNMEYIDKLFLPFQRLHTESEFEGSGIGLATVQRIINRHAGRIWAEAKEGEGACFCFTLPQ
jgi:PAS domain S-box-containing protein